MSDRSDLLVEIEVTLNAGNSYSYYSDWFDSGDIDKVAVIWSFSGGGGIGPAIQQSTDKSSIIQTLSPSGQGAEFQIVSRYFRLALSVSSGYDGSVLKSAMRVVGS